MILFFVLKFVDNTILFLRRSKDMVSRVLYYLTIFTMISGVSINLSKNIVTGIGFDLDLVAYVASELHCRNGCLPMKYLDLPIGGKFIDCSSLDHVVELCRDWLVQWKAKHLFLRG